MPVTLRSSQVRQPIIPEKPVPTFIEEDIPNRELELSEANIFCQSSSSENTFSTLTNIHNHELELGEANIFCQSSSFGDTSSTITLSRKLSSADARYETELAVERMLPGEMIDPPCNFQELRDQLDQHRTDLNIDDAKQAAWLKKVNKIQSANEGAVIQALLPDLLPISELYESDELTFQCGTRWCNVQSFSELLGQPQPDQTLGLPIISLIKKYPHVFSPEREYLDMFQPLKGAGLPHLTVEVKGPKGSLHEAGLQNRLSGRFKLDVIMSLKRALEGLRLGVRPYVRVALTLSIELTAENIQVTCHWITTVHGTHHYWSMPVSPPESIRELVKARRLAWNALDWIKLQLQEIHEELARLDQALANDKKREAEVTMERQNKHAAEKSRKRARSPSDEPAEKPLARKRGAGRPGRPAKI